MPVTLLLADDSATIQRVIEMTFAEEDVRVVTVGDGGEAIERIAADPPDIVLADTNMPGKDGYEVSAFVKADSARSRIPVVLLTGAFEPVDDERAREVGCDAVLVKPFEPKAVIERVRELVGPPADAAASPAGDAAERDGAPDGGREEAAFEPVAAPAAVVPDTLPALDSAVPAPADSPPAAPDPAGSAPAGVSPAGDSTVPAAADSPPTPSVPAPSPDPSGPLPVDAGPPSASAAPAATPEASAGAADVEPRPAPEAPAAVPAVESPAPPSLAAAFASLLAAEQGDLDRARAAYPWPRPPAPPSEDDLVERVAERVVERLSNDVTGELVSEVVARVAERLVRDQIGRINPA